MKTKYERIIRHLLLEMKAGNIRPGGKLPSVRDVAAAFGCSPNTVVRAYQTLEQEHLIYSVAKSGYYMVEKKQTDSQAVSDPCIDFISATPSAAFLPFHEFQHCLQQAIARYRGDLFGYTEPQGIPSLRRELQKHLRKHQIFAGDDQLCVLTGAQQAFSILTRMPFPNGGDTVLVEQPTYFGFLETAKLHGCAMAGIERDERGIDLGRLEALFRTGRIRFFYTVPRFLNPLGVSYSTELKRRIVRLAAKYDVYIVEDDYFADLETDGKADPLYALDNTSRVIYVKSFSKTTMPGLRLAVAVLPRPLANLFRGYKQAADISTPVLSQGALEIYIKCGMYERHIALIRRHYRDKMADLLTLCDRMLRGLARYGSPDSGVFVTLELPKPLQASVLIDRLQRRGVLVSNVDRQLLPEFQRNNRLRLCVIGLEQEQMEKGIAIIAEELESMQKR